MKLRQLFEGINVVVKDELNPALWEGRDLKPDVRKQLLKIAKAFEEYVGIPVPAMDYLLVGSNANYNWSEGSDLDLHIIVPGTPTEIQRELYNAKKQLWSDEHNILIKGIPVEIYVQGRREAFESKGQYSILKDVWIRMPSTEKPKLDDSSIRSKFDYYKRKIELAILGRELRELEKLADHLKTMRTTGLEERGEYSTENLTYKLLRKEGLIEKLYDTMSSVTDQELSLESSKK